VALEARETPNAMTAAIALENGAPFVDRIAPAGVVPPSYGELVNEVGPVELAYLAELSALIANPSGPSSGPELDAEAARVLEEAVALLRAGVAERRGQVSTASPHVRFMSSAHST
jgi:hypothetical protein